jgi:hypothetical protein
VPALVLSMAGTAVPSAALLGCLAEGPPTTSRGAAPSASSLQAPNDPPLDATFEDDFERAELGPAWLALSPAWKIQDGKLCAKGARNRGIWLRRTLPRDARIEVTATAGSEAGDLKVELWGDGRSGATGATYDDATSYLAIFGGWRNARHVLARLDEHGDDRSELTVEPSAEDPRRRPVTPGQPYRFRFDRRDGRTLRWEVDGVLMFELPDDDPLDGAGHDHLGFNDWDAPVCFDDLRVVPLSANVGERPPATPPGHD